MINSINSSENQGAISIMVLFKKEKHNMAYIESKDSNDEIPEDGFINDEIGKIVTVVKDTRPFCDKNTSIGRETFFHMNVAKTLCE